MMPSTQWPPRALAAHYPTRHCPTGQISTSTQVTRKGLFNLIRGAGNAFTLVRKPVAGRALAARIEAGLAA